MNVHEHLIPVGKIIITRGSCTKQLFLEYRGEMGETSYDGTEMPQRQDSLKDQLITAHELAVKMGCYDAADFIKERIK